MRPAVDNSRAAERPRTRPLHGLDETAVPEPFAGDGLQDSLHLLLFALHTHETVLIQINLVLREREVLDRIFLLHDQDIVAQPIHSVRRTRLDRQLVCAWWILQINADQPHKAPRWSGNSISKEWNATAQEPSHHLTRLAIARHPNH